jgi:hypothetical protein
LDWSASSLESGSTSSTSNSNESNDSGSGGYVEITLSDTDAKNPAVDVEKARLEKGATQLVQRNPEKA